jgi:GNAT superfamily N-acetyltransferase
MNIRLATINDAEDIQKINSEVLQYDYPLEKAKEMLRLILALDWQMIYVAEIDGELVGYVQAHKYLGTYFDLFVNIIGLAVASEFQGQGVGKALMIATETWAKNNGAKGVRLNSGEKRLEAHAFYEKIGYDKAKLQANFQKMF